MNTIYRSVWNAALGTWVAVSEVSRRRGRRASSVTAVVGLLALASLPAVSWAQASGGTAFIAGGGTGGRGGAGNGSGGVGGSVGEFPGLDGIPPSGGNGGNGRDGAGGPGGTGGAVGATSVTGSVTGGSGTNGAPDPDPVYGAGAGGGGGAAVYTADTAINVGGGVILRGGNGGAGGIARLAGGGGGGGAGLQSVAAGVSLDNAGQTIGGNGGAGAIGQWAGGGGGGGDGIVVQGNGATVTNTGTAIGGNGGNGAVVTTGGMVGGGGEGGAGLALESSGNSVLNTGALVGGAGGAGGNNTANGIGGAGLRIRGNANSIVNSGTLMAGMNGDGITPGDAVRITGNDNQLELRAGSSITGLLRVTSGTGNVLRLAGDTTDGTTALNSATYSGFARYEKTGASTWALTGINTGLTPWFVTGGALSIADDGALGNSSGALTLDGGTLNVTGDTTATRAVSIGAGGGTFDVDLVRTLTLNGEVSGGGALQKTGRGTLVLGAANSYTGGTTVAAGSLEALATGALGAGPVSVAGNASLVFGSKADAGGLTITAAARGPLPTDNAGFVQFRDSSSAGTAHLIMNTGASAEFRDNASAGSAVIENHGGLTNIRGNATAGNARVTNFSGGQINLLDDASAGQATFVNESGGLIDIFDRATADQASVVNNAGGRLLIRSLTTAGISVGSLSGAGDVNLGAKALTTGGLNGSTEVSGVISGTGGSLVKVGTGTLTLSGANTYTGGTALRQGRLNLGNSQALGTGTLSMDDDTTLGFSADGLTIANAIQLTGSTDPVIDTGAFNATLSGAISGGGFITKEGSGTLTLSGANNYTGATNVAQGTLKAGAANTFSAASAHSVASGATLDLAGFSQTVASLANSGTVSLAGAAAGTTLTVTGAYVGNGGVLRLGTVLNGTGPSDRLVLDGAAASASGRTTVQVSNLGGLGALTSGNGIEVVTAKNGATTTAQTTKDAFSLANGHVDAGAYEYRLYAADANGAGENWYLRSSTNVSPGAPAPVITYRAEASLYSALPGQLRQGNLAMLGDLRKRVGDDDVKGGAATPGASSRRAWARVLSTDIDIQQGGAVSPSSKGRLTGFQAGTDLLATPNWRAGLYVGQLDGDASVRGFASGIQNLGVGRNDLRSQYLGVYGTYTSDSGFYADAVVQSGRHRYTVEPLASQGMSGKGNSLLGSIEVGQSFALGGSGWRIEPQLQLIHQHMDLGNSAIVGAVVQPQADSGWIARAGLRVKGEIATGAGTLQPYGRFNVYRTSSGADIARFVNGATTTDIAAPTGGTSTELAGGFTLALGESTSLYGEIGKLWASGGNARVKSSINGSVGVRVKW
ncbi:autotransporter outer membrane beta-barrel domain-containing protein [Variovorax guangxiensis]|uniref:Autotransporter outer membrane beta-barrel domain-containing protein n=1 Tax=Variovorax guangxiensis TaxID=1775474 RepID=A0A3S0XFD9_9BURK|nr:autotransporter outer membrane beta-barrel domain-containing protein [Variovorax guangxiensis]RUR68538.1 autotransporter outer membrane beta-barrel domain-containing protein [Variovorax guangxiensis]